MPEVSQSDSLDSKVEIRPVTITTPEGLKLAADIAGDPWRPRLVFVHGGGQSRRSWRKALQAMALSGFSVVSYNLRGHGDSDWSQSADYSLDAHVRDLTAIVNGSPKPPAIVGSSLIGGRVALETAAVLGKDKIPALVLVDMTPKTADKGLQRISSFLVESRDGFDTIDQATSALERCSERKIQHNYFQLASSIRTDETGRIFWRWDPALAKTDILMPAGMEERLTRSAAHLQCPVLVVRGTQSDCVTDACVAHLLAAQPAAEITEIEGAGHLLKSNHIGTFCDATLDFLHREHGRNMGRTGHAAAVISPSPIQR